MPEGQYIKFSLKTDAGWSTNIEEGIVVNVCPTKPRELIVVERPVGLQVMSFETSLQYRLEHPGHMIDLPSSFVKDALVSLESDEVFPMGIDEFKKLCATPQ